jgi:hypothetical protein
MTEEEIKIGEQWVGILAKQQKDFSSKSLFNATANYLKAVAKGQTKKFGLSIDAGTLAKDEKQKEEEEKNLSLMEAAKRRKEADEEAVNLLATSEDDLNPKKYKTKKNV